MTTWYLAVCRDCKPIIPQPFSDADQRTDWAGKHAKGTGHRVVLDQEER
jgi:hypothetical protein